MAALPRKAINDIPCSDSRSSSNSGSGNSARLINVTSAPALRAPLTAMAASFLLNDSLRRLPAKARIRGSIVLAPSWLVGLFLSPRPSRTSYRPHLLLGLASILPRPHPLPVLGQSHLAGASKPQIHKRACPTLLN